MVNSFSRETKNSLCEIAPMTVCCRRALFLGLVIFRLPQENEKILELVKELNEEFARDDNTGLFSDIKDFFRCGECRRNFLRGLFLSCGTIAHPAKLYQLELSIPDTTSVGDVVAMLKDMNLPPKVMVRRGANIIYYKGSENIADFLNSIGAQKAAFDLINEKIRKDLRNNANRHTNCDAANINRTVSAAHEQLDAIRELQKNGRIAGLKPELYETAMLRLANESATLLELAEMHNPPITKSGVNHRLKKIVEINKNTGKGRNPHSPKQNTGKDER